MISLKQHINSTFKVKDLYEAHVGRVPSNGKVFCPFHPNSNTPAAKIYDEYNIMKCFSCNKSYTPYDFLIRFDKEHLTRIKSTVILPEVEETHNKKHQIHTNNKTLIQILRCIKQELNC